MMPPLPPPQIVAGEGNTHSTSANSSPAASLYAVYRVLKARASLDRPPPAGCMGGKDGKGDGNDNGGNAGSGSQELDPTLDCDGPPLPPPKQGCNSNKDRG
jgi:hypothetical protein